MTRTPQRYQNRIELLQGTLDMLILQVLESWPAARIRHRPDAARARSDDNTLPG